MGRRLVLGLLVVCTTSGCKAQLGDGPHPTIDAASDGSGRSLDASPDGAGVLPPWGAPQAIPGANLGNANNTVDDPTVSSNELELIYDMVVANTGTGKDLWVMKRATKADAWGTPTKLTVLDSAGDEESPRLSPDDLTIYFGRDGNIFTATRPAIDQPWSAPTALAEVNTGPYVKWMAVCAGGHFLISRANPPNGQDLYEGTLGAGPGVLSAVLSSPKSDSGSFLSPDCLTAYLASPRRDGVNSEIFVATRATVTSAWSTPTPVPDFNLAGASQDDPWQSPDARMFVFSRNGAALPNTLYYSVR